MKRMVLTIGLVVLVLAGASWVKSSAQTTSGAAEQELLKLEKAWADADLKGDATFLEKIYAPNIVVTNSDGSLWTGAQDIASMKSGETVYSYLVSDNMKVYVYGDTGFVIGRSTEKGKEKGKEFSRQSQWTDTWVKISSRWQCVATQSTWITQK
jgi:ketosteroid isomerase-like protein